MVWNINFIFPYIGNNHPNWLIFFRGVAQPPTSYCYYYHMAGGRTINQLGQLVVICWVICWVPGLWSWKTTSGLIVWFVVWIIINHEIIPLITTVTSGLSHHRPPISFVFCDSFRFRSFGPGRFPPCSPERRNDRVGYLCPAALVGLVFLRSERDGSTVIAAIRSGQDLKYQMLLNCLKWHVRWCVFVGNSDIYTYIHTYIYIYTYIYMYYIAQNVMTWVFVGSPCWNTLDALARAFCGSKEGLTYHMIMIFHDSWYVYSYDIL